jgi:hypothetical protein
MPPQLGEAIMATHLYRPDHVYDSLSRDHRLHVADPGGRLAVKIAIGVLLGVLLAIAGNLTDGPRPVERVAQPGEAPPAVAVDGR